MSRTTHLVGLALLALGCAQAAEAATATVDCGKRGASINATIDKFDKSIANTVTLVGACVENVKASGHRDLTMVATAGATLTAAAAGPAALWINASRVTVRDLPVSGAGLAESAIQCDDRSVCLLYGVSGTQGLSSGLVLQKQSSADVVGGPTSQFSNNGSAANNVGSGIVVAGQSSINVTSNDWQTQAGPTIANNVAYGIQVIDGSFLRIENSTISNNGFEGVVGQRGAVMKIFSTTISGSATSGYGIRAIASTLQFQTQAAAFPSSINTNAAGAVRLDHLSFAQIFSTSLTGNGGAYGVTCSSTAVLRSSITITDPNPVPVSGPSCL